VPPKKAKRLVVDTSIARAAGALDATDFVAKSCRDVLDCIVQDTEHIVVMPEEIAEEWNKHQSNSAKQRRATLMAKKRLDVSDVEQNDELREKILATGTTDKEKQALLKDCRLVEAALASDKIILSRDGIMRGLLVRAAKTISELRTIMWVDPTIPDENVLEWLLEGAKVEKDRQLGNYQVLDTD
jgi:hypothetical protein